MKKISEKTLKKIRKEKIMPVPRWKFLLKNYVIWSFFGFSILIGSISFAVSLFMILSNDWDIHKYLQKSFLEYSIISLPYLWILFLAVFIFLAQYNLKHTKRGYCQKTYIILLLSIIISVILGSFLYHFGFGERINDIFAENLPYYRKVFYPKEEIWTNPEKGLLGGFIVKVNSENDFSLKDFKDKIWQVEAKDANLKGRVTIRKGEEIKIIGNKKSKNIFKADEIRPWPSRGKGKGGWRFESDHKNSFPEGKLHKNFKNLKGRIRNS